jgi:hypothetical protein
MHGDIANRLNGMRIDRFAFIFIDQSVPVSEVRVKVMFFIAPTTAALQNLRVFISKNA